MYSKYEYITPEFKSNCLLEALKAKVQNMSQVKLYFCRSRITENGRFQWMHLMWSDGENDYDFSDKSDRDCSFWEYFWYSGAIRKFPLGFAEKYSKYRNKK